MKLLLKLVSVAYMSLFATSVLAEKDNSYGTKSQLSLLVAVKNEEGLSGKALQPYFDARLVKAYAKMYKECGFPKDNSATLVSISDIEVLSSELVTLAQHDATGGEVDAVLKAEVFFVCRGHTNTK